MINLLYLDGPACLRSRLQTSKFALKFYVKMFVFALILLKLQMEMACLMLCDRAGWIHVGLHHLDTASDLRLRSQTWKFRNLEKTRSVF